MHCHHMSLTSGQRLRNEGCARIEAACIAVACHLSSSCLAGARRQGRQWGMQRWHFSPYVKPSMNLGARFPWPCYIQVTALLLCRTVPIMTACEAAEDIAAAIMQQEAAQGAGDRRQSAHSAAGRLHPEVGVPRVRREEVHEDVWVAGAQGSFRSSSALARSCLMQLWEVLEGSLQT